MSQQLSQQPHEQASNAPALITLINVAPVLQTTNEPLTLIATDFFSEIDDAALVECLTKTLSQNPQAAQVVAGFLEHSPFLTRVMKRHPEWLLKILQSCPEALMHTLSQTCVAQAALEHDDAEIMRLVRQFRQQAALLIAIADCGGVWDVIKTTAAITLTADTCVKIAIDHQLRVAAQSGKITLKNPDDPSEGSGLVVLALGKHGAIELNYSSDIDLVVFFDPEAPAVSPSAEPARIFVRMAQGLVKLLQERTGDDYAFRVDLRLRPDPGSTQAAVSLPAAYTYYETLGQNWERAAYIKARPIAGDIALANEFLKDIAPFIWRKYFDFAAIADIHAMKRQIHAVRGHDTIAVAGHNIKLGRGGIREIEFFVQTQQLVFGGRREGLRGSRTLDMLKALCEEGWITPAARDELTHAYGFLRTVEHRLQMMHDEQTQRLPVDDKDIKAFALFCGFPSLAAFSKELIRQAQIVQGHYAMLFEEAPSLASDVGSLVFTGTEDDPDTIETIQRLGFREPSTAIETVKGWHFGRRPAITSARAREVLTELTPALLVSLGRSSDPDAGLAALDKAFQNMPAATELLTLLASNTAIRDLFATILGTAPRLADIVAARPHSLDAIIDPAFVDPSLTDEDIESRMRGMVGTPEQMEDFLDRIRDVVRHKMFLDGARVLSGVLSAQQVGSTYTSIAQVAVRLTLARVKAVFEEEYGVIEGGRVVVLGMGRLGSGEMTAGSDLDLVVIYDRPEEATESNGARKLDPMTYYGRLTQRLVGAITAPTRRGILYEVDMRLRPSGSKGPLATQLASFIDYFQTTDDSGAETWERMALTKARVVAGDETLKNDVEAALKTAITPDVPPQKIAKDIVAMRQMLATEKGDKDPFDMKLAAGALVDIDFMAAFWRITFAKNYPALHDPCPAQVIQAASDKGIVSAENASVLLEARRLFNDVLQWERLLVSGRFDPTTLPSAVASRLASAVGLPDIKVLKAHLDDMRAQVVKIRDGVLKG
jgi:[glutamine synthetase] adenylyltransferase / [glutamine synthetase]-adenylyl-L-tyrosine phosphorylase